MRRSLFGAHILNVKAVALEPETLNYRLNTANVLAENQQTEMRLAC